VDRHLDLLKRVGTERLAFNADAAQEAAQRSTTAIRKREGRGEPTSERQRERVFPFLVRAKKGEWQGPKQGKTWNEGLCMAGNVRGERPHVGEKKRSINEDVAAG